MITNQGNGSGGWQARAERVLAQGCLTYSKSRRYYVSAQPSHVVGAYGKYLILEDGTNVFDTVSGLGANLINCEPPKVNGGSYSLPATVEVEAAEELLRRIPFERVKFVKTGSEADQAAARYMRAYTGRRGILRLGYSGWHSEFIGSEKPGLGCPPTDVVSVPTLDDLIDELRNARVDSLAGVLLEPVQLDPHVGEKLRDIRRLCDFVGALLCFDEVITGFRWPKYTVAQTLGVMPDLMTMGKALGGGCPLGCVLGSAKVMDIEDVFVSGTFSGETAALASACVVMDEANEARLRLFWRQANDFHVKFNYRITPKLKAVGYGTRIVFKDENDGLNAAKYMQEMYTRYKVLIGPVMFPKLSWEAEDYSNLLDWSSSVVADLDKVELRGDKPRPKFKRN